MKLRDYLKDKAGVLAGYSAFLLITLFLMRLFQTPFELMVIVFVLGVLYLFIAATVDFGKRKKFYDALCGQLEGLDKKYLIFNTLEEPDFLEGKLIYDALYEIGKSMTEQVNEYRKHVDDFKDFIELWVHEIKLPIASLLLMAHNNPEKMPRKYMEQINRLDAYADQVLYYVRAEHASEDYRFDKTALKTVISKTALKNKDLILENNISLLVHDVDFEVVTDGKWLEFIVNQIVSNSIKYMDETGKTERSIEIWAEKEENRITLHIKDNGIGIPAADIPRVCDKSFTGENGRKYAKSTGMGLFIVKQLCNQLGHKLAITSREKEYTDVSITFGGNEFYFDGKLKH